MKIYTKEQKLGQLEGVQIAKAIMSSIREMIYDSRSTPVRGDSKELRNRDVRNYVRDVMKEDGWVIRRKISERFDDHAVYLDPDPKYKDTSAVYPPKRGERITPEQWEIVERHRKAGDAIAEQIFGLLREPSRSEVVVPVRLSTIATDHAIGILRDAGWEVSQLKGGWRIA